MFVGCHRTAEDRDYREGHRYNCAVTMVRDSAQLLSCDSRNFCDDGFARSRDYGYANAHYDELAFWDRRLGTNQTVDETLYFKASRYWDRN